MSAEVSLFGPIPERNVVFLLDTSGSMYFCLRAVQDNIVDALLGLAEKGDCSFNVIEFSKRVNAWADRCVSCNSQTVAAASRWIRGREASTGNNLAEAILMAFEDRNCDGIYVVSNSLPAQRKTEIIDSALHAAKGRPVNCIFLASTLSDSAAEELLHDLAWETCGSFTMLEVSESGHFQRATLVFDAEQHHIRSTSGHVYPKDKYCSVIDHPLVPRAAGSRGIGLPWQSRYNPFWWTQDVAAASKNYVTDIPLTRYHAARALLKEDEVRDTVLGTPALPGAGILLIDKKVLARRIEDGYYYLGRVKSEISRDRFLVQFEELNKGKYRNTVFQEVWIYDIISFVDAFRHPIIPGDKALVPVESGKYAPAVVLQGHEQRSDPTPGNDKPLIVNHLDGRSETLEPGFAIWIPNKLYERVSFELRLPYAARKSLESHIGYPDAPALHDQPKEEIMADCYEEEEVEVEGDVHYEEVLVDENPCTCEPKLHEYYESLYPQWPWWWKMWYQRYPVQRPARRPPQVIRRTKIVRPPGRVRIQHVSPPSYEKADDMNFVDYEDSAATSAYLRRIYEKEQDLLPDEVVESRRRTAGRRVMSPSRLSYADEIGIQTTEADIRRANDSSKRDNDVQHLPWRYWRIEEPANQLGESVYASNLRASSSPTRRREDLEEQMSRAARRRDAQRWWEAPAMPRRKEIPRNTGDVEYSKLETFERHEMRSADPGEYKPEKTFVDYVAQDRGVAEWNERTEPKPRTHRHHHHHQTNDECHFHVERRHYPDKYVGRESVYYEDYHQQPPKYRENSPPPAGKPALNRRVVIEPTRSRRAHHLQRLAAEEEQELRQAESRGQAIGARASYNASVAAWFAEKEQRSFEREQDKIAALQRKRAVVDSRHRRSFDENIPREQQRHVEKEANRTSATEATTNHPKGEPTPDGHNNAKSTPPTVESANQQVPASEK